MIKVDEEDPVGELDPSFPYRDVTVRRNVDVKEYYNLEEEIGRGKFGTVYKCREKKSGFVLAAKFVGIARRQDRKNVEREVEIMRTLQHPRLIQLYDAFESANVMCVVLELIEGGELFERVIDDDFILTERACTVFMRQICEGVEFIHRKNVIHLDLKPENILCLTKTGNRIKIIDFGLARKFEPDKKLQVLFGTPEFVAPEVVNFDQISFATDMWSVGVICYVLLSGLSPFMGETDVETMANVTVAQYDFDDEAFEDISDVAKDFISSLLVKDKEARLTASECLSHPWLRRKMPPPPPSLVTTKENLKTFVDRYITTQPICDTIEKTVSEKPSARIIQALIEHPVSNVELNMSNYQLNMQNLSQDLLNGTTKNEFGHQNAISPTINPPPMTKTDKLANENNKTEIKIIEPLPPACAPNRPGHIQINHLENGIEVPMANLMDNTTANATNGNPGIVGPPPRSQDISQIPNIVNSEIVTLQCGTSAVPWETTAVGEKQDKVLLTGRIVPQTRPACIPDARGFGPPVERTESVLPKQTVLKECNFASDKINEATNEGEFIDCQMESGAQNVSPGSSKFHSKIDPEASENKVPKVGENIALPSINDNVKSHKTEYRVETIFKENSSKKKYSIDSFSFRQTIKPGALELRANKLLNPNPNPKIQGIVLGKSQNDVNNSQTNDKQHSIPNTSFEVPKLTTNMVDNMEFSHHTKQLNKLMAKESMREISSSQKILRTTAPWFTESHNTVQQSLWPIEKIDRRASDISCHLHDEDNSEGVNLAEEIQKLSARLLQMSNRRNSTDDDIHNNNKRESTPSVSQRRDPISQFLASHGVVHTRRPKFKFSNLNRDVPIGSPPPASNIAYYMTHNLSRSAMYEASSVEKASGSKMQETETLKFQRLHEEQDKCPQATQETSSIESLASYFKTSKTETNQSITYFSTK